MYLIYSNNLSYVWLIIHFTRVLCRIKYKVYVESAYYFINIKRLRSESVYVVTNYLSSGDRTNQSSSFPFGGSLSCNSFRKVTKTLPRFRGVKLYHSAKREPGVSPHRRRSLADFRKSPGSRVVLVSSKSNKAGAQEQSSLRRRTRSSPIKRWPRRRAVATRRDASVVKK